MTGVFLSVILAVFAALPASAQGRAVIDRDLPVDRLRDLSLEELMQISVTSVAGIERGWFQSPSAITVVTAEDIRRAGARSIPEALRLVPGMFVGRSGSHSWRIGARGFSGGLAPRNLVLIDGRVAYDAFHGGVFWEVQDTILGDIDRIEVIRGPGPTLWGVNAVNGVINIITKDAADTQGLRVVGAAGTYERAYASVRYGATLGDSTTYRVYGKYLERDRFDDGERVAHDDWRMAHGGFRVDHAIEADTRLTVLGGGYNSLSMGEVTTLGAIQDRNLSGAHILARLDRTTAEGRGWLLQQYYDRTNRDQAAVDMSRDSFQIEFRHFFPWGEGNDFIWGLENRYSHDKGSPSETVVMEPGQRTLNIASGFVQNTFTFVPEQWFAMLGTKLSHDTYTGLQFQPSARLWWTPDARNTYWGAVSRAVRLPSRLENESALGRTTEDGFEPVILPGRNLRAEELLAYELGWRTRPADGITFDATLFYHDYSRLISIEPGVFELIPSPWNNLGSGHSYGVVLAADWFAADDWRLGANYSLVRASLGGPVFDFETGDIPQQQASVRSHLDITPALEFNTALYYVDRLSRQGVPDYVRLDTGVRWRVTPNADIEIWGQNLLDDSYPEASTSVEFPRGFYVLGRLQY